MNRQPIAFETEEEDFVDGLKFVLVLDAGGWSTRVTAAPEALNVKVGDTLVSYVPTWGEPDGPSTRQSILERDLPAGLLSFSIAVNRDGKT